jgi:hypothetical protein
VRKVCSWWSGAALLVDLPKLQPLSSLSFSQPSAYTCALISDDVCTRSFLFLPFPYEPGRTSHRARFPAFITGEFFRSSRPKLLDCPIMCDRGSSDLPCPTVLISSKFAGRC